jgi:hypothetical protein
VCEATGTAAAPAFGPASAPLRPCDWCRWAWPGDVGIMGKVVVVLGLELCVLPVVYGLWVDICTMPLVDATFGGRMALLQRAPTSWVMLHWVLGMAYVMCVAAFVSTLRQLLKPGAPGGRCSVAVSRKCAALRRAEHNGAPHVFLLFMPAVAEGRAAKPPWRTRSPCQTSLAQAFPISKPAFASTPVPQCCLHW